MKDEEKFKKFAFQAFINLSRGSSSKNYENIFRKKVGITNMEDYDVIKRMNEFLKTFEIRHFLKS